ncbi:MAG: hypothetical protein SFT90_00370, partial [Rickettsiales bacterium]|nr:hypothetical protein [Rickettsiales bacterium]
MNEENKIKNITDFIAKIDDAEKARESRRQIHINNLKEVAYDVGLNISILEETSGGTNKETLFVLIQQDGLDQVLTEKQLQKLTNKLEKRKETKGFFNSIGTVILPKEDNWGHGKSADEGMGVIIATKLMGLITNGKIDKAIDFLNEDAVKAKLGDAHQAVLGKVQELKENSEKLKKLLKYSEEDPKLKVTLKTPEVYAFGAFRAKAGDGNEVEKAWYIGSRLPGEVTGYKEEGNYEVDFAKRQAIGDSLFANLVTEVLGEGGIKKLFGENDPFSPKHMMEKAD